MDFADKLDMMDDDCDIQGFPIDEPPITNADHIRGMSDEELAKWLSEYFWGRVSLPIKQSKLLDWLRQPWEGGDNQ